MNYEALSYCWGDPTCDHHIYIEDKPLAITASLHSALSGLRSSSEAEALWADAICIDHEYELERNTQVLMMEQIYCNYAARRIYLGEEAEDSQLVPNFLVQPYRLIALAHRKQPFIFSHVDQELSVVNSLHNLSGTIYVETSPFVPMHCDRHICCSQF